MLDKRDELIARLGKSLGLVSDTALSRATELKKRFPARPLDQLLDEAGFLTKENKAKLAAAFNATVRQQQQPKGAPPAAKGPLPRQRGDDSGVIVPDAEDASMLGRGARHVEPLRTPPSDEDGLGESDDELSAEDEQQILSEPTIMMQDEELEPKALPRAPEQPKPRPQPQRPQPPAHPRPTPSSRERTLQQRQEDELLAEPTIMVPDDEMDSPAEAAPKTFQRAQTEDDLLAEPTLMVPDDELAPLPADDGPGPMAEDAILAEPTIMLADEDLRAVPRGRPAPPRSGAPGSGRAPAPRAGAQPPSRPPLDEAAILAEPTIVLPDDAGPRPEAPLDLLPEEPASEMQLPDDMTAGGVQTPHPSAGALQPGVKKRSGKLDRREFERRSKLRMSFEGMTLGDYLIEGELARGAFGVVLKVRPEAQAKLLMKERGFSGELMAMKVMLETNDPEETRRFMDEVKVLIGLVHPNIIRIFDAGVENGLKFYTMELINGVDSRTLVREQGGKLPVLYAMRITKDVAGALATVHQKTIYHRDMKPANIMIDRGSQPYRTVLIDFGLVTKKQLNKADEGLVLGTPSYMPPEQAKPKGGFGEVNATSDVYSLGATFFFLMTGQAPFPGKDPREIIKRVCSEPPPDPVTLNAEIPKTIALLCLKCLAKPQRDRFTSAKLLEKELEKELASAQLKLKAKGFMRKIFGGGGGGKQPPPPT